MKIIPDKNLQELLEWHPHPGQEEILSSKSRDIAICAGRRYGKSATCAYKALKLLLMNNKRIVIIAPTYDLAQRVFDYLQKWIAKSFPKLQSGISMRPLPQIRTPWGSILECKSAENPTGILGQTYDLVIVDEASRIPRKVWETYVFPTTAQGGKALFISTPLGKNWFYERWLDADHFHFKTSDNPYINQEEVDRARQKLPEQTFKQEYLALFLDDAASVFRGVRNIIGESLEDARPGNYYIMGVDLGKHEDFTVLTIADRYTHKIVYFDRFRQINYPLQKSRIIAAARRYNNARITIDSTGIGDPIADDLRAERLIVDDFHYTNKSKQQLIDKLSISIEQRDITIPNIQELVDELESFGYQITDSGRVTYSAPQGLYDDCVNSLALAVWGLQGKVQAKSAIETEWERIRKRSKGNKKQFI